MSCGCTPMVPIKSNLQKSSSKTRGSPSKKSRSKSRSRSKSPVRIPTKKGELTKYGYSVYDPQKDRHKSLKRASKEYGALSVFRKLNVLVIYNLNINPKLAKKYKIDRDWIKKNLM